MPNAKLLNYFSTSKSQVKPRGAFTPDELSFGAEYEGWSRQ
jgi:hypothetical protein